MVESTPSLHRIEIPDSPVFAGEPGQHKWQRRPENDRHGRTHTSTITVALLAGNPVKPGGSIDYRMMRGKGNGGQKKNKTSSCIVATHRETGLTVRCEDERSATRNKDVAEARVWERLTAMSESKFSSQQNHQRQTQLEQTRVRSVYVQHNKVVDHKTGRTWRYDDYLAGDWS